MDWLINILFWFLGYGVFGLVWFGFAYLVRAFVLYIKKQDEGVLNGVSAVIGIAFAFMFVNYFEPLFQFFWDRW